MWVNLVALIPILRASSVSIPYTQTAYIYQSQNNDTAVECADKLVKYSSSKGEEVIDGRGQRPGVRCNSRLALLGVDGFVLIGGTDENQLEAREIYYFDTGRGLWSRTEKRAVRSGPSDLSLVNVASGGGGKIFVTGGEGDELWVLDFGDRTRETRASLNYGWRLLRRWSPEISFDSRHSELMMWRNHILQIATRPVSGGACGVRVIDPETANFVVAPIEHCSRAGAIYFVGGEKLFRVGGCNLSQTDCFSDLAMISLPDLVSGNAVGWIDVAPRPSALEKAGFWIGGSATRLDRLSWLIQGKPVTPYSVTPPPFELELTVDIGSCGEQGTLVDTATGKLCECAPDFTGFDCEVVRTLTRVEAACSGRGRRDPDTNECVCFVGYEGTLCEFGQALCICLNGGQCDAAHACHCAPGFTGANCELTQGCPRACCGRGDCVDNVCYCRTPFDGPSCALTAQQIKDLKINKPGLQDPEALFTFDANCNPIDTPPAPGGEDVIPPPSLPMAPRIDDQLVVSGRTLADQMGWTTTRSPNDTVDEGNRLRMGGQQPAAPHHDESELGFDAPSPTPHVSLKSVVGIGILTIGCVVYASASGTIGLLMRR